MQIEQKTSWLEWWYRLSLPHNMPQSSPKERQHVRYARLTSAFALLLSVISLNSFGLSVINPPYPITPFIQGSALGCLLLSILVGKFGQHYVAATLIVAATMISVLGTMITVPLDPIFVPTLTVLVIPIILAGSLMPPVASLVTGAGACAIIVGITLFQKHTAYYDAQMKLGYYSETVFVPIFVCVVTAVVTYVIMRSLLANIYRADRAEEIVALREEVERYQRQQLEQQKMLQHDAELIAQVHASLANGALHARVPLDALGTRSPLWSVAVPLNNLLNRVQGWKHEADLHAAQRRAIAQLTFELNQAREQQRPPSFTRITNELDPLYFAIVALLSSKSSTTPSQ